MASDDEEEEMAQLRAQRSQRTGFADLVRRGRYTLGFQTAIARSCHSRDSLAGSSVHYCTDQLLSCCHPLLQKGLQEKQRQANTAAASFFEEPDTRLAAQLLRLPLHALETACF